MIGLRLTVAYQDGRSQELRIRAPAVVAWEAYARRQGIVAAPDPTGGVPAGFSPFTMFAFLAYAETNPPDMAERPGFDTWLRTVDGVEPVDDDEVELPAPFPVEASPG